MTKRALYHPFRASLLPRINPHSKSHLGKYTAYGIKEEEYVGLCRDDLGSVIDSLTEFGYEYNALAAAKYHPESDDSAPTVDDGSYRKVPETHPDVSCELTEEYSPNQCQYHVHIYDLGDSVELYSHYELRPDIFSPTVDIARLKEHYRPEWGETYLLGETSAEVEQLVW